MSLPPPSRRRRPLLRVLLATLAVAAPTAVALGTAPTATSAPEDPPSLALTMPAKYTTEGGGRIYTDFGLRVENSGGTFELWLQRDPSYTGGVRATLRSASGDVDLGTELTDSIEGLQGFLSLSIDPVGAGKTVTMKKSGCIAGRDRISPDADARNPFPDWCEYSTFSLGAVQGIPEGWAGGAINQYGSFKIGPGRYDVTARITPKWANALGISAEDRVATQRLVVKKGTRYEEGFGRDRTARAPGTDPSATAPSPSAAVDPDDLPPGTPLPDLRALPAFGMQISRNGNFLQFSATVWNAGESPLVVDGFRRPGEELMDGYQYFFDDEGEQLPDYVPVGEFEWDPKPTHLHWHFRSFAAYSLLPLGEEPHNDGHDHGIDSRKEAFCLAPTDAIDFTVPGADWSIEGADLGTSCGEYNSRSVRQVLQSGWGDTYAQFRAGQSFDLRDLDNGCYRIWVEGNPAIGPNETRLLVESDYTNNTYTRKVCIGGKEGARTIRNIEQIGDIQDVRD